ncbi:hypothetical protein WJX72_011405 [[Myrmecia] bisecta]|uniref:Uncharacterized protein n=1 Tax=[Myrmecia] bisecta TaxID=41462 RepID=A0AAW1QTG6_9CHLO
MVGRTPHAVKLSHRPTGFENPITEPLQSRNAAGCNLTVPQEGSPAFASERERLQRRSAVDEERERRQASTSGRQEHIWQRRQENIQKEAARWEGLNCKLRQERERCFHLQHSDLAKTNMSGADFDIIALRYNNTPGGQRLKHEDDVIKYNAALRTKRIYDTQHCVPHNIITGEPLNPTKLFVIPPNPL